MSDLGEEMLNYLQTNKLPPEEQWILGVILFAV
jgi:hypothetical protein